jgi:tripartite-type tricarboxylate transporter receptor subunit TctC
MTTGQGNWRWIYAGKVRAYAVTVKTRLPAAPDIPTVDEAGLPGFFVSVWRGLWAQGNAQGGDW